MAAAIKSMGIYDLLAPQFLVGFEIPAHIDQYLSLLAVTDLQSSTDNNNVLYTGTVRFPSQPGSAPVLQHRDPSGAVFDFHDITFQFRLTIPRLGSSSVQEVVEALSNIPSGFAAIKQIFDAFGKQPSPPTTPPSLTDYPGLAFQLDLLLNLITFHLGPDWRPGKLNADFSITPDPNASSQDVRIVMPKVLFRYTQGQDIKTGLGFSVASWGNAGFDSANDLAEGEVGSMDPPLALHKSGRVAFGIDTVVLDLSENSTPAEILDYFGTDESFTGLYIKALQVYYTDENKEFALNFAARDALISFAGQVWLEAELDLLFGGAPFRVNVTAFDGNHSLPVNAGTASGTTWVGGSISMPPTGVIYLQVEGGIPPFTFSADFTPVGGSVEHLWHDDTRRASFSTPSTSSESGPLVLRVTDSAATPTVYQNTLTLNVQVADASPAIPAATSLASAEFHPDARPAGIPDEDQISFVPSASGTTEQLVIYGGSNSNLPGVRVDGSPYTLGADRQIIVDVLPGAVPVQIRVDYAAGGFPSTFNLLFAYDQPKTTALESTYYSAAGSDPIPPEDDIFPTNIVPAGVPGGTGHVGADALRFWAENALDLSHTITINGEASNEGYDEKASYNQDLSQRRADVASAILGRVAGATSSTTATGQTGNSPDSSPSDRVAIVAGTAKSAAGFTLTGNLTRPATASPPPAPAPTAPPTAPSPPANRKPTVLRRLSIRVRLEMNVPVMMELSGEIDFQTETDSVLQDASGQSGSVELNQTSAASANPVQEKGLVDFTLNVTYDMATHDLTETLTIGAAPADIDGLLRMTNQEPYSTVKDILGAVMIFTPILNAATDAIDPKSAGDWVGIAVDLGVPVLIGGLGFIHTTDATLYGGTLQLRENIPGGSDPVHFTNASLTFDYGASFRIDINALDVHSTRSMSVRYKAVGVNLHFGDPPKFQFVLDTSKGYSLDLADPGLFKLPSPLGDLLKIAGARIARFNPITLEVDLEIKADLGIVTVDKFLIKVPLDGSSAPMILPSGVKINIPSTLIGSGSVTILGGGFEGTLDITLVPLKLRIAASVGVQHISQPPREATAFYLGLEVDFPAPIILGSTGLGLFGLFGLFAMNYDRVLPAAIPGDAVGPDLKWLMSSKGTPYLLNVDGTTLWDAKIDNWAFGVGVVVGTVDGFLLNMRGMFLLELPGPRIIVTVNLGFVEELPGVTSTGMDAASLDVGIIGILDMDFGAGQITLGVMIDLEISELIEIKIPVQLFFDWNVPSNWHFWLGTITTPASADILGIVRGSGYFMLGGEAITPFPPGTTGTLPGVAVAMGIAASIIWGSEEVNIYLKVAASADFGVSFSPHLFIVGNVHLEGALHLLIVSVGATGDFLLKAPDPVYLAVHVCGSVSLFFFSVSACVDFSIGSDSAPAPPPGLISRMYLQSFAPVIAQGQGGERPIDASLGNAIISAASGLPDLVIPPSQGAIPVVPIDSVPVLQMLFGVDVSSVSQTFTEPIPACVTYPGQPGVNLGGGRSATYSLSSLTIDPPLPAGSVPPTAWRPNKPATDTTQTQVDLALLSRNPSVTTSAVERSTELTNTMTSIWGATCNRIAPPVCVFWAFCGQRLGSSPNGWTLYGYVPPDPSNTTRTSAVPNVLKVEQPSLTAADALLLEIGLSLAGNTLYPAQVIGIGSAGDAGQVNCVRAVELPEEVLFAVKGGIGSNEKNDRIAAAQKQAGLLVDDNRWLRFHTGHSRRIRLLLGINAGLFKLAAANPDWVVIRERNEKGALIAESKLLSLHPTIVNLPTSLPAEWLKSGTPTQTDCTSILFLFDNLKLLSLFVEFKPKPQTAIVEVAVKSPNEFHPSLAVGVIESCPLSEGIRYENASQIQTSTTQTIQSYLDGGSPIPQLAKDTLYTITAKYDVTTTEADGSTNKYSNNIQSFQFKTDNQPPAAVDPWVLCTFPDQSDSFVFYNDPVDIIFNDRSIVLLFAAYEYQLQMDLRAADGLPDVLGAPLTTTSVSGVGTAAYDTLLELVKSGQLPCVGSTSEYDNHMLTAPVSLRPLMGYTLDLSTSLALPAQPAGSAVTPLFRRSFSTGRYADIKAAAHDLGSTLIVHRALAQKLTLAGTTDGTVVPDQDVQDAFVAAGEQALPAPEKNAIVIYWAPSAAKGPYVPNAILLDSIEPLWRTRPEPTFANPIASDPSFKVVTISDVPSLSVSERAGSSIGGFVRTPGGARTVALFSDSFSPPASGTVVTLALHRPASNVYGNPDQDEIIIALTVSPRAPWENDHV
jgi:hypothetical protein